MPVVSGTQVYVDDNGRDTGAGAYLHVNSNATEQIKTGPGVLKRVSFGVPGSAWVATLYDSATTGGIGAANMIATIDGAEGYFQNDLVFNNGLVIVTSGTTPGDLTVTYL